MNQGHLNRILALVQSTGKSVVVTDASFAEPVVVMSMAEYESLTEKVVIPVVHEPKKKTSTSPASTIIKNTAEPIRVATEPITDHLNFNDATWKNDWESVFFAEHPEIEDALEDDEEEKFYIEPLE
jgi:hypothetical protein